MKRLFTHWIIVIALTIISLPIYAQSQFSGDMDKFGEELIKFMGPNLNTVQKSTLNEFVAKWDSTYFDRFNKGRIIDVLSSFRGRAMKGIPHFNDFMEVINAFTNTDMDSETLASWLNGLSEMLFDPHFTNTQINKYVNSFGTMVKDNVLCESTSNITWKVYDAQLQFVHDTTFKVLVWNGTLKCETKKDSTKIKEVTGVYVPERQQFIGSKGIITFEKAGYDPNDVYAVVTDYTLDLTKSTFSIDSALFTNSKFFPTPVAGKVTDQAISYADKSKAQYPRFETYKNEFFLKDYYEGIDYIGGLSFEGANVKGKGAKDFPAYVNIYRNDTLYFKIASQEFSFAETKIIGREASMSLYLDDDSIVHSNIDFSYDQDIRRVNIHRNNSSVSKGPYSDSYHNLDMYFEFLLWDMDGTDIIMSKALAGSFGQAEFQSESYFTQGLYNRLQGIDEYHPLVRLKNFAEWYYSDTFPIDEFAKWLNKSLETVTGLCIDLATKGFIFYNKANNTVTLKQKVYDYVAAFLKKQDYDAIDIISEVDATTNNASLNIRNKRLTINGISKFNVSTAQNVTIIPYDSKIEVGRNRTINFDGIVEAGLFTVYGHNFSFDYDTFKIRLNKIDSLLISVETGVYDEYGNSTIEDIHNVIQLGSADLYIDRPTNKSGLINYEEYPIFNSTSYSYIFYDKLTDLEGVYTQDKVYFRIDPFSYENTDHYTYDEVSFLGEFHADGILEPTKQRLTYQGNRFLRFNMEIPQEGIPVYDGAGRLYENLSMTEKGLIGSGTLTHLTSTAISDAFKFFPDSMSTVAQSFTTTEDSQNKYPSSSAQDVSVTWLADKDLFEVTNKKDAPFEMFDNGTTLNGKMTLTSSKAFGEGVMNLTDARISSDDFTYTASTIYADSSSYNLMSSTNQGYAFIANDANTTVDFDSKITTFHLNSDTSMVMFPTVQYICTMTDFTYDMESKIMEMEQKGKSGSDLMSADELLRLTPDRYDKPTFMATNIIKDTISFTSWKGRYNVEKEYIEAENINYIPIADALIQPDSGKVIINKQANLLTMKNALVAINNNHLIHSATIDIENVNKYSGTGIYDYIDENGEIQPIEITTIRVDTLSSKAIGTILAKDNFMLSQAFGFQGNITLFSNKKELYFEGAASLAYDCGMRSKQVNFKSYIDPNNVMIPIGERQFDVNNELVVSGSYLSVDSSYVYPTLLSSRRSWSDVGLVTANGHLWFDKSKRNYMLASLNKIADPSVPGNMIVFDTDMCTLNSEGKIDLGTKFDWINVAQSGTVTQIIDSSNVDIRAMLAFDFHFSQEALSMMANELRLIPTLQSVDMNSDFSNKAFADLIGEENAASIKTDLGLYSSVKGNTSNFNYEIILNDVNLYWDEANSSFRSKGKIGIGFIGKEALNVYVDGYVEIQRRHSGDMFDIYLKADNSTWYYFSYVNGNMMTQSSNFSYNGLISNIKQNLRKHPESTAKSPYTYMIASEDRLSRFLRRMEE